MVFPASAILRIASIAKNRSVPQWLDLTNSLFQTFSVTFQGFYFGSGINWTGGHGWGAKGGVK